MKRPVPNNSKYVQPAFLICAAVLALAGGGMSVATKRLGLYLKKEPLPLKKPLDQLDEAALAPYRIVAKQTIENEDVLESLGTEDYIQWVLEDPCRPQDSPMRRVLLFVTYYPEPDRVPHTPEECYTGSGYSRLDTDNIMLQVDRPGYRRDIPARYLVFGSPSSDMLLAARRFPVTYLFRVDGQYAGNRDSARAVLNKNIFSRFSYFCKVELAFNQASTAPTKEEAIAASERVLGVVLPILEREHWPDWTQP
ncbi:MAG: exosortase-associated EpsI family protein [Sedimentisphaerales bacterium]|nr:exosortase-associated EpsI family protein [Sedimentisphaerales bacterium]